MAAEAQPIARRGKLPYRFTGTKAELDAGLPLADGEIVMAESALRCRTGPVLQRPCFVRLTNQRLAIAVHYALQPDRFLDIPAGALVGCGRLRRWTRVVYQTESGHRTVDLDTFAGGVLRKAYPPELPLEDVLKQWQAACTGQSFGTDAVRLRRDPR